ncbi:uncharacterized protein THITE_2122879 [Thermothielavioides terrestris NRRL 8126]|uniref:Uncharacterized protein n=1 Tax=Thermothielavioides terrestris (strain ATCC 38088 / NRRL 8126) TaxID=578455 RepID=G2REI7_THETT|nr:uncharacterized protein THITE_2122879 [Thermothielavioides terrestris NRRL 8126]AEO70962.1 hypothetical protein THITE_2122879 [Thermothielavioides terrestris NRRL 8126]
MVRSVQQKYASAPVRATKHQDSDSSSLDLSDDNGYSGVEDVSDSDDEDEERVFAAEEEHIINDASRKRSSAPPRPLLEDDEEDDADEESEADEAEEEEAESELEEADPADDSASWGGISSDHEEPGPAEPFASDNVDQAAITTIERHVRFAGVPDSDSDSTTTDTSDAINDFFPDIFVEQSALDPSFRREIEADDETSSNDSFWDFHSAALDALAPASDDEVGALDSDITPMATPGPSQPSTDASTPVAIPADELDLDGYESDGETTEEDVPEPVVRKRQIRRTPSVEPSSDSDTERPVRRGLGKPRAGRFDLDRSDNKPIGVVDPNSGKMIIFTPRRTNQLDLSPESLHLDFSRQDLPAYSPPVRNPGFIMMGAMASSNTFGDFMNMQPFGPAEAFFPCTSDALTGEESDDSYLAGVGEDDEESMLRIEDFITFHNDPSDGEESGAEWNGDLVSSPTRPKTAASSASAASESAAAHPLLTHFDNNSDAVGAFRRNQINQQLIYSDKASQESLAFSGPYYHGTLRGIKAGSLETVTTPITPIRRQKRSSTKRKASGNHADAGMHKRHRSISDMEVLRI